MNKIVATLLGALVVAGPAVVVAVEGSFFERLDDVERQIDETERERADIRQRAGRLDDVLADQTADPETARRAARDLRRDVAGQLARWDAANRRADRVGWVEGPAESRAVERALEFAEVPDGRQWRRQVEVLAEVDAGVEYSQALVSRRARLEVEYAQHVAEGEEADRRREAVADEADDDQIEEEIEETQRDFEEVLELLNPLTSRDGFYRQKGALLPPVGGEPDHPFGPRQRRESYTTVRHTGVTWEIEAGTEVRSVADGTVAEVDRMPGYGKLVIVDHGDDHHAVYAHLGEHRVEAGDEIDARDVVGMSGETGSPEGPRLYFELRRQGQPVDPEEWFVSQ